MSVLFFDPRCPEPYTAPTFGQSGLGGTEATTIRVAEALDAVVVQHNRLRPFNPLCGGRPWETPPCHPDGTCKGPAAALFRKMQKAGISRWHPDPLSALEAVKQ